VTDDAGLADRDRLPASLAAPPRRPPYAGALYAMPIIAMWGKKQKRRHRMMGALRA